MQLGEGDPQQLLITVVYIVGLHFALRGGTEHYRSHRPGFDSQISFEVDDHGVERVVYRIHYRKLHKVVLEQKWKIKWCMCIHHLSLKGALCVF